MQSFLAQAVQKLLQLPFPLKDLTVVMPSQRAAVFFRRELEQQLTEVSFSPQFITVENLVAQSTGLHILANAPLLFRLYEAHCEVSSAPEPFDDFAKWAPLLLADFNEIDRHLVDAPSLFDHLADIKRLESWGLEPEPTELIKNYLALWKSLPPLYQAFTQNLLKQNEGYQGLAYRQMAEQLDQLLPQLKQQYGHFFFIGFNALNQAEEQIFERLDQEGMAHFFWDIDAYYFKDSTQEAGQFLRNSKLVQRLQERGTLEGLHHALGEQAKEVHSIAVNGQHLQAAVANQIVSGLPTQDLENTAVVLADEALLTPFLNNLSPQVQQLNVTMGLPLKQSPLAGFFDVLLGFPRSWEKNKRENSQGEALFYHQQWDDLLAQPFFKQLVPQVAQIETVRAALKKRNLVYASYQQLVALGLPQLLPDAFFSSKPNLPAYFSGLAHFCEQAQAQLAHRETQMLYGFFQLFNQLAQLFDQYPYVQSFETAHYFYRDLLQQQSLDLVGEPLQGLQLMGMLETRTLDFETVVLTSVNEEVLPQGRSANSLIPFDLKKAFNLPTFLDKDAIYAYHFYRLLQRAKKVYLLYNNGVQGLRPGEPSRFLKQLEIELQKFHRQRQLASTFRQSQVAVKAPIEGGLSPEISKTPAVMERLKMMAQEGLSPSALATYLRNPVDFYYQYVLRLRDPDELDEELDLRIQGTVTHQILEGLYGEVATEGPTVPKSQAEIEKNFALTAHEVQKKVEEFLRQERHLPQVETGLNLLAVEIITSMVHQFLMFDAQRYQQAQAAGRPIEITGLEQSLTGSFTSKAGLEVKLKGNADRIERSHHWHIIDYKTGDAQSQDYGLQGDWGKLPSKPKALQLLVYGYLFLKAHPEVEEVRPQVISLRNLADSPVDLAISKQQQGMCQTDCADFEEALEELLAEIYNPEIPFTDKAHENE